LCILEVPPAAPIAMLRSPLHPGKLVQVCITPTLVDLENGEGPPHDGIEMELADPASSPPVPLVLATYGVRGLFLRGRIVNA
jgi:hypothetical protein